MSSLNVYCFEFPIEDYYGEAVFFQQIFFVGEYCPHHDDVVKRLEELVKDEQRMADDGIGMPDFAYKQCREVLGDNKLPFVGGSLTQTNIHVEHPKFGSQPLTVKQVRLHDVSKPFVSWFDGGTEY